VFCRRVCSDADIVQRIEESARRIGLDLDRHWAECCAEIAGKWSLHPEGAAPDVDVAAFTEEVTPLLRNQLELAARRAKATGQMPVLAEAVESLGTQALLLVSMIRFEVAGTEVCLPKFLVQGSRHVLDYILERITKRKENCQADISKRVAELGNRLGSEFEKEIRRRLTDYHTWQENAVRLAADRRAAEQIGFFQDARGR
jgi:hypothetical protein